MVWLTLFEKIRGDRWMLYNRFYCLPVDGTPWIGTFTLVALCWFPLNARLVVGAGTLATLLLLLSFWTIIGTKVVTFSDKLRLPLVTAAFCLGVFLTFKGCNNNHFVKPLSSSKKKVVPEAIGTQFERWLESRPQSGFIEQPYPVFLVCAEGGGIRAAITTFLTLSRLQQVFPSFREHLYAISSVSGGSLGAGIYVACNAASPPQSIEAVGMRILSSDLLSPVVGMLVGPEVIQKVLPFPFPIFDRTKTLERVLEERFRDVIGYRYFQQGYREFWRTVPSAPLLLVNLTNVETDARTIIAPVNVASDEAIYLFSREPNIDLAFSTSVILSARFPVISSAAYLILKREFQWPTLIEFPTNTRLTRL
jgi:hypothetical protein